MTPQEQPPKLPSFKAARKPEEAWPSLGASLPLRGGGTLGLRERLKTLGPREIAFILAGISVLMMAPLAEYFLTSPPETDGILARGFDRKGPLFEDGTSLFEAGTGGFSPGALIGEAADVITPLNVRDPSALIMGPGAVQRPPAGAPPPRAPAARPEGWKEALSEAATAGAKAGTRAAPKLPKPDAKLAGALRGLSALSGATSGGGPAFRLEPISASNVPNRAKDSAALTRSQAVPGFRGPASRSPATAGAEGLKDAGFRQADVLNRGQASNALQTAAGQSIPGEGGAGSPGGGPGGGGAEKAAEAGAGKDSKTLGESLGFLRAKMEMERAVKRKHDKLDWAQLGRRKMIEELMFKTAIESLLGKGLFEPMGSALAGAVGKMMPGAARTAYYYCPETGATVVKEDVADGPYGDMLFKKVGDSAQALHCPGGWRLVGAQDGGGARPAAEGRQARPSAPPDLNPGELVSPLLGQERSEARDRIARLSDRLRRAEADNCRAHRPMGAAYCEGLAAARRVAEEDLPGINTAADHARDEVVRAYRGMEETLEGLRASLASSERTLDALSQDAGGRGLLPEARAALERLTAGDAAGARARLEGRGREIVAAAVGEQVCQTPGAVFTEVCELRGTAEGLLKDAEARVEAAQDAVVRAQADAARALGRLDRAGAALPGEAPWETRRSLDEALAQARSEVGHLQEKLGRIGGEGPGALVREARLSHERLAAASFEDVYGEGGPARRIYEEAASEAWVLVGDREWGAAPEALHADLSRSMAALYGGVERVSPGSMTADARAAGKAAAENLAGRARTLTERLRRAAGDGEPSARRGE